MINKRPLPHTVNKKTLVAMYIINVPEMQILKAIQDIMIENRINSKTTEREIKNLRCISRKEFLQFIEQFGQPEGYYTDKEL
jgi:hypothetical protein